MEAPDELVLEPVVEPVVDPVPETVVELGALTWGAVHAKRPRVLVVPVGSLEQHGPHLPLATDTIIAGTFARHLCRQRDATVLAPTLPISASGEHQGFAGTLSLGTEVTAAMLIELVRSADWSDGVVIVNAHGGNADALRAAVDSAQREGRKVLAWWPRVDGGDLHAGASETSLMLAIAPELVRLDQAVDGPSPTISELRQHGVAALSPSGVLGAATRATAELGQRLLGQLGADLVGRFDRWYEPRTDHSSTVQ